MRELGLNPSEAELNDLVNEADLNNDGVISFDGMPPLGNSTISKYWPGS
jgi:calmodulin